MEDILLPLIEQKDFKQPLRSKLLTTLHRWNASRLFLRSEDKTSLAQIFAILASEVKRTKEEAAETLSLSNFLDNVASSFCAHCGVARVDISRDDAAPNAVRKANVRVRTKKEKILVKKLAKLSSKRVESPDGLSRTQRRFLRRFADYATTTTTKCSSCGRTTKRRNRREGVASKDGRRSEGKTEKRRTLEMRKEKTKNKKCAEISMLLKSVESKGEGTEAKSLKDFLSLL